jgi:hypothetical protein
MMVCVPVSLVLGLVGLARDRRKVPATLAVCLSVLVCLLTCGGVI